MERRDPQKTLKIPDIWLASALSLTLKIEPKLEIDDNLVTFIFPFSSETVKALSDLNSGAIKFDYITFSERVKSMKNRMITLKKAGLNLPK